MQRLNNIDQHISDYALSVKVDPNGTAFPSTVTDLQKLAEAIDPHALVPLPQATETTAGVARLATAGEVQSGISIDTIVTPATLQAKWNRPYATETEWGLTRYAAGAELQEANQSGDISLNTRGLWSIIRTHAQATETKLGTMAISTTAAARAGTDNTTGMSPAKVKIAIDTFAVTHLPGANENTSGTVKIAASPVTNVNQHAGIAVSPRGFILTRATETRVGTTLIATQAQANDGTDNTVVLTPKNLPVASYSQRGTAQLYGGYQSGNHSMAMTPHGGAAIVDYANSTFVRRSGDTMSGALTAPYMYSNVGQQGHGHALVRLDYLNSRLNGLTISRAIHRGHHWMGWGHWYDMGTVYFNAVSSWLGCRVQLPIFSAESCGGGCRPHYHYDIIVTGSTGYRVQQTVSRIYVPHDKYGNGLGVTVTPTLTFPMPPGTSWVQIYGVAHNASCMCSPQMHDGMVVFTAVPY